jgi:hypothetical protein
MTALERAIARLNKKKIRFLMIPDSDEGYIMPTVTLVYREGICECPYIQEDYEKESGKHLCTGEGFDNDDYEKPKEQLGYKLNQFLMGGSEEKKKALKDLFKWWNDYGGKLPQKQYNILGDILERLVKE